MVKPRCEGLWTRSAASRPLASGMTYRTARPRPLREGAPARPTSPPSPLREGASSMVDEPASRPAAAFETLSAAMRYEAREVFRDSSWSPPLGGGLGGALEHAGTPSRRGAGGAVR